MKRMNGTAKEMEFVIDPNIFVFTKASQLLVASRRRRRKHRPSGALSSVVRKGSSTTREYRAVLGARGPLHGYREARNFKTELLKMSEFSTSIDSTWSSDLLNYSTKITESLSSL